VPIRADGRSLLREYVQTRRHAHARWRAKRMLTAFLSWLRAGRVRVCAATEGDVVSFLAGLSSQTNRRGRPFSDGQRQAWLSVVRSFFRFLEERRLVFLDPTKDVRLPRSQRLPPPVLSEQDAQRLMAAPAETTVGLRDRAILELVYGTGLRLSECVRLDLQDLSLLEGRLLVRSGKGGKDRALPLVGRAAAALSFYLREVRPQLARSPREEAVFLARDGERLSRSALQARLGHYGQALGLRMKLRPHLLRHTCATHLLQGGADIRHVQRLLGHKEIRTTAIYTRVSVTDLREVLERAHPRARARA